MLLEAKPEPNTCPRTNLQHFNKWQTFSWLLHIICFFICFRPKAASRRKIDGFPRRLNQKIWRVRSDSWKTSESNLCPYQTYSGRPRSRVRTFLIILNLRILFIPSTARASYRRQKRPKVFMWAFWISMLEGSYTIDDGMQRWWAACRAIAFIQRKVNCKELVKSLA